jgi:hypothetical protein
VPKTQELEDFLDVLLREGRKTGGQAWITAGEIRREKKAKYAKEARRGNLLLRILRFIAAWEDRVVLLHRSCYIAPRLAKAAIS